jgi:hypothetical protein
MSKQNRNIDRYGIQTWTTGKGKNKKYHIIDPIDGKEVIRYDENSINHYYKHIIDKRKPKKPSELKPKKPSEKERKIAAQIKVGGYYENPETGLNTIDSLLAGGAYTPQRFKETPKKNTPKTLKELQKDLEFWEKQKSTVSAEDEELMLKRLSRYDHMIKQTESKIDKIIPPQNTPKENQINEQVKLGFLEKIGGKTIAQKRKENRITDLSKTYLKQIEIGNMDVLPEHKHLGQLGMKYSAESYAKNHFDREAQDKDNLQLYTEAELRAMLNE